MGRTDTEIRVSTESWHRRKKLSHHSCQDLNPWPFDHKFSALTTELSLLHMQCFVTKVAVFLFRHKFYQFNQNSIIKQTEQLFYPKAMWTRKSDLFVCITCILSTWQVSMHLAMTKTLFFFLIVCLEYTWNFVITWLPVLRFTLLWHFDEIDLLSKWQWHRKVQTKDVFSQDVLIQFGSNFVKLL